MKREYYKKGDTIFWRGDDCDKFYVIKKGSVEYTFNEIQKIPFVEIKSGYFGEFEMYKDCKRLFTVVASSNSVFYTVSKEVFY